jgi:hypothetical protein
MSKGKNIQTGTAKPVTIVHFALENKQTSCPEIVG